MNFKISQKHFWVMVVASLLLSMLPYLGMLVDRPSDGAIFFMTDSAHPGQFVLSATDKAFLRKAPGGTLLSMESRREIGLQCLCSFLFVLLLFIVTYYIIGPWDKIRQLRAKDIGLYIVGTLLAAYGLSRGFNLLLHQLLPRTPFLARYFANAFSCSTFAMIILGANLYARLIFQKQNIEIENEKLKRKNLQGQYEALKNQLSPHFLFNTLNALQTLIRETPLTAHQYVNHLSTVLRYILESSEKELVFLEDEMRFSQSYIFLLQMRYESNIVVNTEIPESFLRYKLPSLSVQTLIENAVKHNEISKRNPLHISITAAGPERLRIANNIQKKLTPETGTGIGLSNLSRRYLLLTGKDITIQRESSTFVVEMRLFNWSDR